MARHDNNTSSGAWGFPMSLSLEENEGFTPSKYFHGYRERKHRDSLVFHRSSRSQATTSAHVAGSAPNHHAELSQELRKLNTSHVSTLERAFNENRHPSRDERSAIASRLKLDSRIVKEWFQNKRHMTRKEVSKSAGARAAAAAATSRPTLDRVASLTELPSPHPRSLLDASYHPDHTPHIWGHMVSSPPSSPTSASPPLKRPRSASPSIRKSPPTMHSFSRSRSEHSLNYRKKKKRVTLEWACANAASFSSVSSDHERDPKIQLDDEDEGTLDSRTEVSVSDEHEAITPFDGRSLDSISIRSVLRSSSPPYSFVSGLFAEPNSGRKDIPSERADMAVDEPTGKSTSIRTESTNATDRAVHNVRVVASERVERSPIERPESRYLLGIKASASSSNTRAEMEAALALCGLFSSA